MIKFRTLWFDGKLIGATLQTHPELCPAAQHTWTIQIDQWPFVQRVKLPDFGRHVEMMWDE
jgi:hypothetical protein